MKVPTRLSVNGLTALTKYLSQFWSLYTDFMSNSSITGSDLAARCDLWLNNDIFAEVFT